MDRILGGTLAILSGVLASAALLNDVRHIGVVGAVVAFTAVKPHLPTKSARFANLAVVVVALAANLYRPSVFGAWYTLVQVYR